MFSRIWQQLSVASPVAKVTATLWLCLLVLLELLGRETKSDWFDLASFVALMAAFILTIRVHRRQPLAIVTWLVLKIDRGLKQFRKSLMNFGVDFRPQPNTDFMACLDFGGQLRSPHFHSRCWQSSPHFTRLPS